MAAPSDHPLGNVRVVQGAWCDACKHHHAGKEVGFICIGCPCPERPVPGTLEDLGEPRELRMFDGITLEGRGLEPMDAFWLGALAGRAAKNANDPSIAIDATEAAIEGARALGVPIPEYVAGVLATLDAPEIKDARIVYGATCFWWDSIDKAASRNGLPCCPHCKGMLLEVPDLETWEAYARKHEEKGNPGYLEFLRWSRGHCYPSLEAARACYDAEAPGLK